MGDTTLRYGLLLPHFGEHASRKNLLEMALAAERYAFDSVWVRDHLIFDPDGMEGHDRTHVDPCVTLGMIASVTDKLILGIDSLIPYRHPIQLALALSSLEFVAGPGRVIAGWGSGTFDHEFSATGLESTDQRELIEEQIAVMRALWTGDEVDYHGKYYDFDNVDIHPSPSAPGSIPLWYCGDSLESVQRAVEYCDGWMPGPITLPTFEKRVVHMRRLAADANRPLPTPAATAITSPGRTRDEGLAKANWQREGALIAGPPQTIIEDTRKFQAAGLTHIVYDLRFRFDEWRECVRIIGDEVLPELRRAKTPVAEAPVESASV